MCGPSANTKPPAAFMHRWRATLNIIATHHEWICAITDHTVTVCKYEWGKSFACYHTVVKDKIIPESIASIFHPAGLFLKYKIYPPTQCRVAVMVGCLGHTVFRMPVHHRRQRHLHTHSKGNILDILYFWTMGRTQERRNPGKIHNLIHNYILAQTGIMYLLVTECSHSL